MKARVWVTPLTIGSFLLVAITGLLMLVKVRGGLITPAHEWLSLIFLAAGILHLIVNWGATVACLKRTSGWLIVGAFVILIGLVTAPLGFDDPHGSHGGDPTRQVTTLLLEAPCSTLAPLAGLRPDELRTRLAAQGITVADDGVPLAVAAEQSHVPPRAALAALLSALRQEEAPAQGRTRRR